MIRSKLALVLSLAFGSVSAFSGMAEARSVPAVAGHAYTLSDQSCFIQSSWAGIKNNCSANESFLIPLENTLTAAGPVTVQVNAGLTCSTSPCLGTLPSCTAYQVAAAGGLITSKTAQLGAGNTTIGTFTSVAPTDTLHVLCDVPGTAQSIPFGIMSVSW